MVREFTESLKDEMEKKKSADTKFRKLSKKMRKDPHFFDVAMTRFSFIDKDQLSILTTRGTAIKKGDSRLLGVMNKKLRENTHKYLYEDSIEEINDFLIPKRLFITFHNEQAGVFAKEIGKRTLRYRCCKIRF